MRWDMKHVIIDRPRRGGEGGKTRPPKGTKGRWQRMSVEEYPKSESMAPGRRYGWNCKSLNEHLSPLVRWLRSNCGRPWNAVYSEICEGLSVRNATSAHVRDHAEQYVLQNTKLVNGVVCDSVGDPIYDRWRWNPFYVDPRDGTLREKEQRKRFRRKRKEPDYIEGKDESHQYRILNGIWYEVEFAVYSIDECPCVRDALTGEIIRRHVVMSRHNGYCEYAKSKRQLGKEEIKKLGLRETPWGKRALGRGN